MNHIAYNLIKTSRLFKNALDRKLNAYDITATQFAVLNQIYVSEGEITAAQIAEKLSSDRPTISAVINRLIKKDVIYKAENPRDKRSSFIKLTPEGEDLIHRLIEMSDELSCDLLSVLEAEELEAFNRYLNKVIEKIEVTS